MPNYNKSFNFRNGVQVDEDDLIVRSSLVGIGTTIPTSELDVRGDTKVSGVVTTSELYVTGISTFGDVHIGTGVTVYSSLGIVSATQFQGDGSLLTNVPTSQWVDINESGIGVTSIYAIGNVGIGTTDPTGTTLQIGGDAQLGQPGVGIGSDGNIHASGVITATTYYGTGTNLTALNASNIASGKLAQSRLPANIDVTGNLNVTGVATVSGSGGLNVNHNLDVNGNIDVDGLTNLDVLNVAETATFVNDVQFNGIAGVTSAYWDRSADTLKFLDDVKATFGDVQDLAIYHTTSSGGYSAIVDQGTGQLIIGGNIIELKNASLNQTFASFTGGRGVDLYYNDTKRFATSGIGVTVYNQLDVTDANVSGVATFQNNINVTKDIVVTGLATAGFVTTRDLYVSGISTLKRAYIDDLQLTGITTSSGGYIGNNIRIGITAANEIDTSGGNLVLDSTGGTVEVTDNLTVSGISTGQSLFGTNISVTGVATAPTVKTQTVTSNSGNLTLDSASGTTSIADNLTIGGFTVITDNLNVTGVATFGSNTVVNGVLDANGGATIDNVRIGIADDNEIDTASGNLTLDSAGGSVIVDDILQTNIGILPDSDKGAYIGTSGKSYAEAYINDVTIGVGATTRISTRGGNLHLNSNEGKVVVDGNLSVSGITTLSNGLDFGDDVKVNFGISTDFSIYHSSNQSYIQDTSGILNINSNIIYLEAQGGVNLAKFTSGSSGIIYYNGSPKLETSGIGVTIFKQLDVNNINVSAGGTFAIVNVDNIKLDGNEVDTTSGNLTLDSAGGSVIVDDILTVQNGANINERLTANNESFLTQNVYVGSDLNDLFVGGGKVGIGTSIATNEFEVVKDSGNLVAEFVSRTGNTTIGLGQSIGIGNSSATVAYVGKNLNITNKTDDGDINVHLASGDPGSGIVTSSSFNVKYGSSTVIGAGYSGGVGINKAVPVIALDVVGSSAISEDLNVSGIVTATRFIGSGTSLTNIPAGQLTGALPALDGSLLTGTDFSRWHNNSTGISTDRPVGIGTTTVNGGADPNNLTVLNAGIVTANYFYGDGSQLTNVPGGSVWTDNASSLSYIVKSVGIGTTSPTDTLTVDGSLGITGTTSLTGNVTIGVDASVGIRTTANQSDSRTDFKTDFYNSGISTVGTVQVTSDPSNEAGRITGIDTTGLKKGDQLLGSTGAVGVSTIIPKFAGITTVGVGEIWIDEHPTNVAITTEVITFGKYTADTIDFKYGESQHYGDVTFVGVGTNTGNTIVFAPGTTDNSVPKPEIVYTNAGTGINTSYQAQSIVGINTLNPRSSLDLGGSKGYIIPPCHDSSIRQVSLEYNPNINLDTRDPKYTDNPRSTTTYPNVVDGSLVFYKPKNRLEVGITTYATNQWEAGPIDDTTTEGGDNISGTIGITTNRITGIHTIGLEIGMDISEFRDAYLGGPLPYGTKIQGIEANTIILDRLTTNSSGISTTFDAGYREYPRYTQFLPVQTLGVSTHPEAFEYMITPKLSTSNRDTLTTGYGFTDGQGTGSMIFNTTTNKMQCYDGTQWRDLW